MALYTKTQQAEAGDNPLQRAVDGVRDYAEGSSARQTALGYGLGDFLVFVAGIASGSREKIQSAIGGLAQSLLFGIDKANRAQSSEECLHRLDTELTRLAGEETLVLPVPEQPKGLARVYDTVSEYGVVLGSLSMVYGGYEMIRSGLKNRDENGKRKINWGDVGTGVISMMSFGLIGGHALARKHETWIEEKTGLKLPQKEEAEHAPGFGGAVKRVLASPSNFTAYLSFGSSLSRFLGGVQLLSEGQKLAGSSQVAAAAAYGGTELVALRNVSDDENGKAALKLVNAKGEKVKISAFYDQVLEKLEQHNRLGGANEAAVLEQVAHFYAPQPSRADAILHGLTEALAARRANASETIIQ